MNENFKLKVAANYPNPPLFYTNQKKEVINGIDFHLVKTLSKYLNISYEFIHSDWEWGKKVNGSWIGMIGKVLNNSANFALGELTADSDRSQVVDFTTPYSYSDITFVTRMTKKSSINANSLLIEPFDIKVWFCLLFTIIFSLVIMKIVKQPINETLLLVIRGLLQQGAPSIPKPLKTYAGLWFMMGLVLSHSYVSVIFLFMSELLPQPEISSITDLGYAVKNGRYIPATSSEGSLFNQIKDIKTSPLNFIGESLIPIDKTNIALKLMLTNMSKLTYICPRLIIQGRAASFGSNFLYLPPKSDESSFLVEQLTIAIPKNFVLKNRINKIIRRLESSAHLIHWERVSMRETSNFKDRTNYANFKLEEPTKGMALKTGQYIFYLWLLGLIVSLVSLTYELSLKYFYEDRRLRRQSFLDLTRRLSTFHFR